MPVVRIAEVRVSILLDYAYDLLFFVGKRGVAMPIERPRSLPRPRDPPAIRDVREFASLASTLLRYSSAPTGETDKAPLVEQVRRVLPRVRELYAELQQSLARINELRSRIARLEQIGWLASQVPEVSALRVYIVLVEKHSERQFVEGARRLGIAIQWIGERGGYSAYVAVGDREALEKMGVSVFTLSDLKEATKLEELKRELSELERNVSNVVDRDAAFASYLKALLNAVETVVQTYDRSAIPEGLEIESLVSRLRQELAELGSRLAAVSAVIDVLERLGRSSLDPGRVRVVVEPEHVEGLFTEVRVDGKRVIILVEGSVRGGVELSTECLGDVPKCVASFRRVRQEIESLISQRRQELDRVLSEYREVSVFGDENWGARRDLVTFVFYVPEDRVAELDDALVSFVRMVGVDLKIARGSRVVLLRPRPDKMPTLEKYPEPLRSFNRLVHMFSVPRPVEVPPVVLAATLFPIFYGLMYGDAGHGLVLTIFGLLLIKHLFGGRYREWGVVFAVSGLVSVVTGVVLYGEFFGFHMGKPLAPLLGHGLEVSSRSVSTLLTVSMFFGFTVMLVSFVLRLVNEIRMGEAVLALAVGPTVLGIYIGLAFLIGGLVWVEPLRGVSAVALPALAIGIAWIPVAYFVLRRYLAGTGESPSSILIFEVIESALAGVANLISFARLLIIVLIHAVFTRLSLIPVAALGPLGIPLSVIFQVLIIVGEGFVTVVQAMRLMYYETFSKFFVGGGTPFTPLVVP